MPAPKRMTITQLETGIALPAQFNPKSIDLELEAFWNRLKVAGRSFEEAQFSNMGNVRARFELVLDGLAPGAPETGTYVAEAFAAMYPGEDSAPGPILFTWPSWISIVSFLPKLKFTATRFHHGGAPTYGTIACELEERRSRRLEVELLRNQGFLRAA